MPSSSTRPGFYAVAKGRKPGIYTDWNECKAQILNYNGAKYKKFTTPSEAASWIQAGVGDTVAREATETFLASNPAFRSMIESMPPIAAESTTSAPMTSHATVGSSSDPAKFNPPVSTPKPATTTAAPIKACHQPADSEPWVVYSDGACRGNGRVGAVAGIGVWWGKDDPRNIHERCPGDQTNNRAELIAIIRVLETAPIDGRPLVIKTDSQYSINCLCVWLNGWKEKGWRTSTGKPVLNAALIKYVDIMLQERREFARQPVELVKVLGHSGVEGNEGADQLANLGATLPPRPDRDWEDLIRQTQARMAMISPPQFHTSIPPSASTIADAVEPFVRATAERMPFKVTHTTVQSGDERVAVPRRSRLAIVQQEARPSESYSTPSARSAVATVHLSPEELESYAECWLSDDEFLEEAERQGVLAR